MEQVETLIIYHSGDMDGYTSGAILKHRFPNAKLFGYDYTDNLPDIEEMVNKYKFIIFVDVTFPLEIIKKMGDDTIIHVIDHHIGFYNKVMNDNNINFSLYYAKNTAACEIAWTYCYPNIEIPLAIQLIGRYDTWRKDEGDWVNETVPFKFYMYGICTGPENFPFHLLNKTKLTDEIISGRKIRDYDKVTNKQLSIKNSFVRPVYGGLRGLCINIPFFNSEVMEAVFDPLKHDIMVGFYYVNEKWSISLRSVGDLDCSQIALSRGGGGHRNAAGFEVDEFEKIFL